MYIYNKILYNLSIYTHISTPMFFHCFTVEEIKGSASFASNCLSWGLVAKTRDLPHCHPSAMVSNESPKKTTRPREVSATLQMGYDICSASRPVNALRTFVWSKEKKNIVPSIPAASTRQHERAPPCNLLRFLHGLPVRYRSSNIMLAFKLYTPLQLWIWCTKTHHIHHWHHQRMIVPSQLPELNTLLCPTAQVLR